MLLSEISKTKLSNKDFPINSRISSCSRINRLKSSYCAGLPGQYDDLNRFIEEQKLFQRLISESSLPKLELDISDNDISRRVENIADWMEQTGALYMN